MNIENHKNQCDIKKYCCFKKKKKKLMQEIKTNHK